MTAEVTAAGNSQQKVSIGAGEKIEITMTAGQALVMATATTEVQGMTMDKSGALLIQMSDGASLVVKNFAEVATAAGSASITLPSGQAINLAELIQTLAPAAQDELLVADASPTKQVLGTEPAAGHLEQPHKVIIIKKPQPHENVVVKLKAGEDYKFAFNMTDPVSVKQQNGQLVIAFKDGGEIIIPNYGAMKDAGLHDIIMKDGTKLAVNDLGDTLAQAAQLNEIEPAAGERGGAHGGGFGFESVFTADRLNSLNKIGPIDPTQLKYGTFDREPKLQAPAPFDDKPIANDDTNTFDGEDQATSGNVITGENGGPGAEDVLSQDLPDRITEVAFGSTTVDVPETGTVTIEGDNGVLTIAADGSYTYTLNDDAQGDTTDQFTYTLTDGDGDSDTAILQIDSDGVPVIFNPNDPEQSPGLRTVDESDLPATSVSGQLNADFFTDTPGSFSASGSGTFSAGGSLAGGNLTSSGHAVTVTLAGGIYTGTANGATVFTLQINADGSYAFDLTGTLDHADGSDPNDVINLNFGVTATDSDGDTASATLTIRVLDDAPIANDDHNSFNGEDVTTSGNVVTGLNGGAGAADALSQDDVNLVTKVSFGATTVDVPSSGTVNINGDYGVLTIAADGSYSYTLNEGTQGDTSDQFTYTLTDSDGDTDTAVLEIGSDGVPIIFNPNDPEQRPDSRTVDESDLPSSSVSGQLNANFFTDTPGTFGPASAGTFSADGSIAGGSLTSGGHPVTVALAGDTYTGTANGATVFTLQINADGSYTFDLTGTLDHADGSNPNDVINLNFGVTATDSDGDTASATLTIRVLDDAPLANDDHNSFNGEDVTTSGNVITGLNGGAGAADGLSQDDVNLVTKVTFGSTTVDVPSSGTVNISGDNGVLTIAADGSYSYTLNDGTQGDTSDQFTYTLTDSDGDTDTAVLEIGSDGVPIIFNPNDPEQSPGDRTVDESDLPASSVSGQLNANFFADTPGSFSASGAGTFSADGSIAGGSLTSAGHPVTVTLAGDTYTGTANGATVFTLQINADGSYTFDLSGTLDHENAADPNDVINLNFGVTAMDSDGDTASATLTIRVVDDAPVANDDHNSFNGEDVTATGNVITGLNGGAGAADAPSEDTPNNVTQVSFGAVTVDVPATGTATISGDNGVLTIAADGSYSYTLNDGTQGDTSDQFIYTLTDSEGDTDTAVLEIGSDGVPIIFNPNDPEQSPGDRTVDESDLPSSSVSGQLNANFFADTPGSFSPSGAGTFSAGGSVAGGSLTSDGHAVTVTLAGDTYTGTANGATVFTLQVNADGSYTFDLTGTLDHADGSDPDDVINLNFGVTATDSDGDTASATLTIRVMDDAPLANDDHNAFNGEDNTTSGNVVTGLNGGPSAADAPSEDTPNQVTQVSFGATTVDVPSSGTVNINGDYGVLTIAADGSYTYSLNDAAQGDTSDQFTYTLTDSDGDTDTAVLQIGSDGVPVIFNPNDPEQSPGTRTVDESTLPASSVSGQLNANFFTDTPGSFSPSGAGTFSAGGSVAGGSLTSDGHAVTVTLAGDTYTGTANGATVFTLQVNADGSYTFDLAGTLDHADGSDPDDVINLNFGVTATDSDGDTAGATLTIRVLDDAPLANDDHNSFNGEDNTTSGNVVTGFNGGAGATDALSQDDVNLVTKVSFGATTVDVPSSGTVNISGDYGVLTIAADGSYTYTLNDAAQGDTSDQFTYTLTDGDGDTDTAVLEIGSDGVPIIFNPNDPQQSPGDRTVDESDLPVTSVSGQLNANFFGDTPGSFSASGAGTFSSGGSVAGGSLTSDGHPVTVTLAGNTYTGTANGATVFTLLINTDGSYTFDLAGTLDHADGSNPNDVINLNFGVTATDSDGDTASATLTIRVLDDAPLANDDHNSFNGEDLTTSGNVISGLNGGLGAADALSQDDANQVTKVAFGATTVDVPSTGTITISGDHGVLTIAADGSYSYILNDGEPGDTSDQFTYTLTDGDGDTDTAVLEIGSDGVPIIFNPNDPDASPGTRTVDETNLSPATSVSGQLNANFFADTPGTFGAASAGTFSAGGSLAGGALTSDGHAVTVSLSGNTYTGTANGSTVFTLQINSDGGYTFELNGTLDHADAADPNDVINLNFGVTATDSDGDTASATLTINVLDDAPIANDDHNIFDSSAGQTSGNVISGLNGGAGAEDDLSQDTPDKVTQVSFGSTVVDVPGTGTATINGDHGVLTLAADGSYTYTLFPGSAGGTTTVMEPVILTDGAGLVIEVTGVQTSGGVAFTVKVLSGTADLNGFYLDIGGDGGPINSLGSGNNMNPTAGFDYAVNLGTVGGSDPDVTNMTFTMNGVDLSDLDGALIGIRATSVGTNREGSVKLTGEVDTATVHTDTTDVFQYTLTDSDGDEDTALLTFDGVTPAFTVGQNVSDAGASTTPYAVGDGHGDIDGGIAGDILVGDVGGATMVNQTKNYNIELVLDVSGSMGSLGNQSSKYYMLVQAVNNLLSSFHDYQGGSVVVNITPFDTKAHISGTFNVSTNSGYADALNFLQHMGGGGTTNYESALQAAINWLGGSGPTPGAETYTYFITDGEPNRYVTGSNPSASGTEAVSMAQIQGSDGTNEIAQIRALSTEVIGVGINVGTKISNINLIDSDGHAVNVHNPADLDAVLQAASPLNNIAGVGGDHISGGEGNDIIFGDAMFTDVLAASHGIAMPAGSGWDVFEALEAASGWTREDTVNYIRGHLTELSQESVGSGGETRPGGNDVLEGGGGSDTIFGQEGNDTISGGAGDDEISGGSGGDIFVFHVSEGVDHITDFNAAHGDKLDFSDVLASFDPLTDSLHNFVSIVVSGVDSIVQIDETGTGLAFHTVVVLEGVHVDLDTLATNGNLIA